MKQKLPYFLCYPKDFLGDHKVQLMGPFEKAFYSLLLLHLWDQDPPGTLPCDDAKIAKLLELKPSQWQKFKDGVLSAFYFGAEDGRWHQKRMEEDFAKSSESYQVKVDRTNAVRQRRHRERQHNAKVTPLRNASNAVTRNGRNAVTRNALASDSDSDSGSFLGKKELEKETPRLGRARSYEELRDFVVQHLPPLTENDAAWAWEHLEGNGWTNDGKAIVNWKRVLSSWERQRKAFPSYELLNRKNKR